MGFMDRSFLASKNMGPSVRQCRLHRSLVAEQTMAANVKGGIAENTFRSRSISISLHDCLKILLRD